MCYLTVFLNFLCFQNECIFSSCSFYYSNHSRLCDLPLCAPSVLTKEFPCAFVLFSRLTSCVRRMYCLPCVRTNDVTRFARNLHRQLAQPYPVSTKSLSQKHLR